MTKTANFPIFSMVCSNWGQACLSFMAIAGLTLSGCANQVTSSSNGLGPHLGSITPGSISMAPNLKSTLKLLDASVLDSVVRTNPFQSLIIEAKPLTSNAVASKPVVNPLSSFILEGILYKGNNSLAILGLPGRNGHTMVHLNQVMDTGDGLQVAVAEITKNTVLLKVLNPTEDMSAAQRSVQLKVGSLVGFRGKNSNSQSPTTASATPTDFPISGLPSNIPGTQNNAAELSNIKFPTDTQSAPK